MLASAVDERFEMAFFAADQACRGELSFSVFQRVFRRDLREVFGAELGFLLGEGLLSGRGDVVAKPPRQDFQVMHLLAFLARETRALAGEVRALQDAGLGEGAAGGERVTLARGDDVEALLDRYAAEGAKQLRIDVGEGLDGEMATRLAAAGKKRGLSIEVRGDDRRSLRQYEQVRDELPPSMLWVRIAIRAAQASRGEQRLLVARTPARAGAPPG
jgi:hypothetical protein